MVDFDEDRCEVCHLSYKQYVICPECNYKDYCPRCLVCDYCNKDTIGGTEQRKIHNLFDLLYFHFDYTTHQIAEESYDDMRKYIETNSRVVLMDDFEGIYVKGHQLKYPFNLLDMRNLL